MRTFQKSFRYFFAVSTSFITRLKNERSKNRKPSRSYDLEGFEFACYGVRRGGRTLLQTSISLMINILSVLLKTGNRMGHGIFYAEIERLGIIR